MENKETTQLFEAVFNEDFETAEKCIKNGADINFINENGDSALLLAIENGNEEMVKLLLKNEANPNINRTWVPSLHYAIDTAVEATKNNDNIPDDSTSIIKLLIDFGADINMKDKHGNTAMDLAKGYHIPAQKLFEKILQDKINSNEA